LSGSPKPEPTSTSAFDYALPHELIASHPTARRDESRLLVIHRATDTFQHRAFRDILSYVPAGDAIVVNETRVIPARLRGRKSTGARAEVLLLHPAVVELPESGGDERTWIALVRPGAKLRPGSVIEISSELAVEVTDALPDGRRIVRLVTSLDVAAALERYGEIPLPPYIERAPEVADRERYQTVFARTEGSVAAPTAGLHFTPELLSSLEEKGARVLRIVLHVGAGTFRPVEVEDPAAHPMHAERYALPAATALAIDEVRSAGGSIWAVGTTVARTLESCATGDGRVRAGEGWTALYIRPPWKFRVVDRLITNFHLPRSTLLMLVAAFGGMDLVLKAYDEAVALRYRFYSYGDAMLLL
jgi:S-adenosylmethionine:tRNA ribosyltransferase-isomerase